MRQPTEKTLRFAYTNYRGEPSVRLATPSSFWFGTTEFHPDPQWIMTAFDHDKGAVRDFALDQCDFSISEHIT